MEKLEICNMMSLSTGHLTVATRDLLDMDAVGVIVHAKADGVGWFVLVCDWKEYADAVPDDLRDCLKLAEKHNCDWLNFDRDAGIVLSLKTYD